MSEEDGITLRGTEFTISASEKVSTGQYENYNPHVSIKGEIPQEALTEANREELKERFLQLHGDLQAILGKATSNRHREPEWESWSFGDQGPDVTSAEELEDDGGDDE